MIGFHFQRAVQNWPSAVSQLPAGTWCKVLEDQHLCRDIKAVNPDVRVVFRHVMHDQMISPTGNLEENRQHARTFFSTFIDGTFWEQELYRWMDAIEEYNEYLANSQDEAAFNEQKRKTGDPRTYAEYLAEWGAERQRWLSWCRAVNDVWTAEYRSDPRLAHIRLVSCNTAIGNDIGWEFAQIVQQHDGILSYHNYTPVNGGRIDAGEWQFFSGRWTVMDADYHARGITVRWLFTEGGAYNSAVDGWRSPGVYNGDLEAYIQGVIRYQLDQIGAWNEQHGNRALGGVLFTTDNRGGMWDKFTLLAAGMVPIAQFVRDYLPSPPPPPPPPPPAERHWNKVAVLVPQTISQDDYLAVCQESGFPTKTEVVFSADSAFDRPGHADSLRVVVYNAEAWGGRAALENFVQQYYPPLPLIEYRTIPAGIIPPEITDIVNDLPVHETLRYGLRSLDQIDTLVIHHTATPADRAIRDIALYHINTKGWPGIAYHYMIKADGRIYQTQYPETISYHVANHNRHCLAICLLGNFTNEPPPRAQLDAARALVLWWRLAMGDYSVVGHGDLNETACPGTTRDSWLPYVAGGILEEI